MFYDLHTPFPSTSTAHLAQAAASAAGGNQKLTKKQKRAAGGADIDTEQRRRQAAERRSRDCWFAVPDDDRAKSEGGMAMARHLGWGVVSFTQVVHGKIDGQTHWNPFEGGKKPFPSLDPREGGPEAAGPRGVIQLSRLHLILDESSLAASGTGFLSQNTGLLGGYDILSVQPTTAATLAMACLAMATPGPNQISIITLDFTSSSASSRFSTFHLKRKPILQAIRSGVVFELLYSPLLPSPLSSSSTEDSNRRRACLSLARDLIRITKGKGIILSSGGALGWGSLRGPQDVINLGTIMGLPPHMAHKAVCETPKKVVLRAQARKTYRGAISAPRIIVEGEEERPEASASEGAAAGEGTPMEVS